MQVSSKKSTQVLKQIRAAISMPAISSVAEQAALPATALLFPAPRRGIIIVLIDGSAAIL